MFKIGEFARISHTSPKMLRHYDQLGLLRPANIDERTNYRYYTLEQLEQIQRIRTLAEVGFTLKQIHCILHQNPSAKVFEDLLYSKRAELEGKLHQVQTQLEKLNNHIEQWKQQEVIMSTYEITLKPAEGYQLKPPLVKGEMFNIPLPPTSDPLAKDVIFKIEAATVPEAIACAIHHGPLNTVAPAYHALHAWIDANGYQLVAPPREIFIENPSDNPEAAVIELQLPVRKI